MATPIDDDEDEGEGQLWELAGQGNIELKGSNLAFRLTDPQGGLPLQFMTTLDLRNASRTLNNIERTAKLLLDKERLKPFIKAVAVTLPTIFADVKASSRATQDITDETKEVPHELKAKAEVEAERILNSLDPLEEIDTYLGKLVCGEVKNRKILFLKAAGTKSRDPSLKWLIIESGEPGAGKTALTKIITKACRCKVVGRLTRHALDYTELSGYDVLVLQEIGHLDKEDDGLSTIKFLSVDDKGYSVEVPVRDPETGEMTTKTYRIPPINVLTTSTRVTFDPQFERRAEVLNPDESEEQTKAIHTFKASSDLEATKVRLGVIPWTDEDLALEVVKEVLARLQDVSVEIAFPHVINRVLKQTPIRTRGDIDKVKANIKLRALVNQRQHHAIATATGNKMIFVSPDEVIAAIELFRDSLESMVGGIDKRTRKVVEAMVPLGFKAKQRIGMDERMKLAASTKRSPDTIYRFLERLYRNNLVKKGKDGDAKNSPIFYELSFDPAEMSSSPLLSSEEVRELRDEMMGVGHNFLKSVAPGAIREVMVGWGRASYELRKQRREQNQSLQGSNSSVKQFFRTIQAPIPENEPNSGDDPLVSEPSGGLRSQV